MADDRGEGFPFGVRPATMDEREEFGDTADRGGIAFQLKAIRRPARGWKLVWKPQPLEGFYLYAIEARHLGTLLVRKWKFSRVIKKGGAQW